MSTDRYQAHDVKIESVARDGNELRIVYRVPMETVFFSPGVTTMPLGGDIVLQVARCGIDDSCAVEHEAVSVAGAYEVRLPAPGGRVFLDPKHCQWTASGNFVPDSSSRAQSFRGQRPARCSNTVSRTIPLQASRRAQVVSDTQESATMRSTYDARHSLHRDPSLPSSRRRSTRRTTKTPTHPTKRRNPRGLESRPLR